MRGLLLTGLAWAIGASASAAQVLRIEAPAARVVVIPEARRDIQVEVRPGQGAAAALKVTRTAQGVSVSSGSVAGWADRLPFIESPHCRGPRAHLPLIVAHTPMAPQIESNGAIFGRVQPSSALKISVGGCGQWTAERVGGPLTATINGAGRLAVLDGVSPQASIRVRGSGQVTHQGSIGNLTGEVQGSGKVRVALVQGVAESTGDVTWGRPNGKRFCTVC
jgi:hypothetical protein